MTVIESEPIVNEIFNVLGTIYIALNISNREKCRLLLKKLIEKAVADNTNLLTLIYEFQLNVVFQYAIHVHGNKVYDYPNIFEVFHGLTEASHGELVKKLLIFSDLNLKQAIDQIHICFDLLREFQNTKNEEEILSYIITRDKPFVVLTN